MPAFAGAPIFSYSFSSADFARRLAVLLIAILVAGAAWPTSAAAGEDASAILATLNAQRKIAHQPIEGPPEALDAFYAALSRTAAKKPGALTRVCHFGDSTVEMDLVPGPIRRLLAKDWGDGGRGFLLLARPRPWYRPYDVEYDPSAKWITVDPGQPGGIRRFGLGGGLCEAYKDGAKTEIEPVKDGPVGTAFSRVEILYPVRPDSGDMIVEIDGDKKGTIHGAGAPARDAFVEVRVPDGRYEIEVTAPKKGTKAYGIIMERDGPGIVYDHLGVNGSGVPTYLSIDKDHWEAQLRHRDPDLVVIALGTNDVYPDLDLESYKKQMAQLIHRAKEAVPGAAVLWMAPLDRATKQGSALVSNPMMPRLIAAQREVALAEKVAFWSCFDAMGGEGSMGRWFNSKPRLGAGDLFHPTKEGGEVLGENFYSALMKGFGEYLTKNGVAPAPRPKPEDPLSKETLQ
ncbi:hypothetical protein KDL45_03700 [bacterium]|nr:hypothetical protein [bacterium]